jgi:glycosyltransferase involved in cell wall biosynthesis
VNALSVNNLSGRHVLLGHLSRLAEWTVGEHEYCVLFHSRNRDMCRDLGPNVDWQQCPDYTAHWAGRGAWEAARLGRVAREVGADLLFTPSGTVTPGLSIPQVSLAQNPWALVDGLERSGTDVAKALLQRRSYRAAVRDAAMMIYNSEFMRQAYRENAGRQERASAVVYQAVDEATRAAAERMRAEVERKPLQVLSVSAWAPHKGAETLVEALAILRNEHKVSASLVLAGGWPDLRYRRRIEDLVERRVLHECVHLRGHVSRDELHRLYAESRVFSLMSRCESFGIPAVEAQAFGTPVVSSNCCGIPEVCGGGGVYPEPGDEKGVAAGLERFLQDEDLWAEYSAKARANASRYRWEVCSQGMLEMFNHV